MNPDAELCDLPVAEWLSVEHVIKGDAEGPGIPDFRGILWHDPELLREFPEDRLLPCLPRRHMACGRDVPAAGIAVLVLRALLQEKIKGSVRLLSCNPEMDRLVEASVPVGDTPFPDDAALCPVLIQDVKEFQCFSVQHRLPEGILLIVVEL